MPICIVLQTNLELEDNFLSKSDQSEEYQKDLACLLAKVMDDMNMYKKCTLIGIIYKFIFMKYFVIQN